MTKLAKIMILDNNVFSTFSPRHFLSGKKLENPNETKCHCLFLWENFIETVDHWGDDEAIFSSKEKLISTFRASDRWEGTDQPARIEIPPTKMYSFRFQV